MHVMPCLLKCFSWSQVPAAAATGLRVPQPPRYALYECVIQFARLVARIDCIRLTLIFDEDHYSSRTHLGIEASNTGLVTVCARNMLGSWTFGSAYTKGIKSSVNFLGRSAYLNTFSEFRFTADGELYAQPQ